MQYLITVDSDEVPESTLAQISGMVESLMGNVSHLASGHAVLEVHDTDVYGPEPEDECYTDYPGHCGAHDSSMVDAYTAPLTEDDILACEYVRQREIDREGERQGNIINMDPELQRAFEELIGLETAVGELGLNDEQKARMEALRKQLTDAGAGMWV